MIDAHQIADEKDPILREVYGMGYDVVIDEYWNNQIVLIDNTKKVKKKINKHDWRRTIAKLNFMTGVLSENEDGMITHSWIKEGDGSAEYFRQFISDSKSVE